MFCILGTPCRGGCCKNDHRARWDRLTATVGKSLTALAIFGFLGAAVIALPGLAPRVEAGETVALAKADRLDDRNCSQRLWLNFDTTCLRGSESGSTVLDVR